MKRLGKLGLIASIISMPLTAFANSGVLRCDAMQKSCVVVNKRITVGDKIGFFNRDNELVAYGAVDRIIGDQRNIAIERRTGTIHAADRVALLENSSSTDLVRQYTVYRPPATMTVGGGIGLNSLGVGDGTAGVDAQAYGEMALNSQIFGVGRAMILTSGGEVNGGNAEYQTGSYSMMGFGLAPGIAYSLWHNKKTTLRAEAGAGFMYISSSVDGDSGLVDHYIEELHNGFNLFMRAEVNVYYRFGEWRPYAGASLMRVSEALAGTIGLGLAKEMN